MRRSHSILRCGIWLGTCLVAMAGVRLAMHRPHNAAVAAERVEPEEVLAPVPLRTQDFGYVGTASCAAANCHGGDASRRPRDGTPPPDPLSPQAYSIWIQRDPHAWAYSTLLGRESQAIARRLGMDQPAHESQACLSCHSPLSRQTLVRRPRFTAHDGVSCEACHGPAEKWLESHKWDSWRAQSPQEKAADGFRNTADLVARARLCAECHVGGEGRDVNHDLIASGHPRLSFALSAFHANLPKHWSQEDAEHAEAIDAKLWQIGQLSSADAALALLETRAANDATPWPEFAEYDCFACHHELRDPSWRQERGFPHGAGALPWGTWYFSLLRDAMPAGEPSGRVDSLVQGLAAEMGRPYPNRDAVIQNAKEARLKIADILAEASSSGTTSQNVRELLRDLSELDGPSELGSWDVTSQRFLGASAAYHAAARLAADDANAPSAVLERIGQELQSIRERLQFPTGEGGGQYLSPRNFGGETRREVVKAFTSIHQLLESANVDRGPAE